MNRWRVRLAELQRDCIAEPGNVRNVQIVQKSASIPAFEHFEQFEQQPEAAQRQPRWRDEEEERAAIIEFDGGVPHAWAAVLDRLDPAKPPVDVPPQRWLRFKKPGGSRKGKHWKSAEMSAASRGCLKSGSSTTS